MNKILIIIEREFLKRIQKKSFIVLTIVSPLIMAALIFVPLWLSSIENDEQQHVAVIDPSGQYFKALKETETFHFTLVPSLNNEMRSEESPYDAVVSIPRGLLDNKAKVCIYSRKEVPVNLLSYVQTTLDDQVRQQRLKASGSRFGTSPRVVSVTDCCGRATLETMARRSAESRPAASRLLRLLSWLTGW